MKQSVRSFSIGLFTAGVIMLIGVYFFDTSSNEADQLPVDEMIPAVEEEGYHVLTESEYISFSVNDENESDSDETSGTEDDVSEDQDTEKDQENESEEDTTNDTENTYTLTIEPGMASTTIGSLLVENEIIDNSDDFNQYLEEEDYSLYIQIGEHELSSDMSFHEIAEVIAN